jgi:K+-transporting ATPase KdpF subunit
MDPLLILSAISALVLFIYLLFALLKPELFP